MQVLLAQLGARRHYAVAEILTEADLLACLYTDAYGGKWPFSVLSRIPKIILPSAARALVERHGRLPASKVRAFQWFGLMYARRLAQTHEDSDAMAVHIEFGRRFCQTVVNSGIDGNDVVYAYRSAALELFEVARKKGIVTVLDQTIVPKRFENEILQNESKKAPGWATTPSEAAIAAYCQREEREWQLADVILCGSEFVKDAIKDCGGPHERCQVVPTGIRLPNVGGQAVPRLPHTPFRVLFVGEVGLRKGIRYLLKALEQFDRSLVECRVIGGLRVPPEILQKATPPNVTCTGRIPRSEVSKHYEWADVLCLPSLCEGSAIVSYEALAHGLPVITTPNAGTLVRDGVEGIIVPAQNATALADALHQMRSLTESEYVRFSTSARARADFGDLDAYGHRLIHTLTTSFSEST
ncbi:MAG: glycosyltransferase family 4 protein [Anaerolineae bacterium]|nr:glycosyltransferase family 4 protein [Anaerolineae bacterium]